MSRCCNRRFVVSRRFKPCTRSWRSRKSFAVLRAALGADSRLEVDVRPETEDHAEQSRSLTSLITTAAVFIGLIMGAGAVFAAANTMYTAVVSRTREIAMLRALGVQPGSDCVLRC